MRYDYFLGMVQQLESERVIAYQGQEYKLTNQLPDAFVLLLPDVMHVLHSNIDKLCSLQEKLVVLGMQPAAQMPENASPAHMTDWCCTLDYIVLPAHQPSESMRWQTTHSLVIDFSTGYVMDAAAYVKMLTQNAAISEAEVLGSISRSALNLAWRVLSIKTGQQRYKF